MRHQYLLLLSVGALTLVLVFFASQSSLAQKKSNNWQIASFTKYVTISGATRVGSEACEACHSDVSSNFRHAFHAQQGIECEDCHGAGSLHVEAGGDVTKIVSYRNRSPREANGACLSCHAQDEKVRNWMSGPHASNSVRCTDCHQVHALKKGGRDSARPSFSTTGLGRVETVEDLVPEARVITEPLWQKNDACLRCHQEQCGQMSLPYHHPLREGKMSCEDCHDPHGGSGNNNLRVANVNQLCLTCHAQYRESPSTGSPQTHSLFSSRDGRRIYWQVCWLMRVLYSVALLGGYP
jgi:predicted CXXCH cytochrome family protein